MSDPTDYYRSMPPLSVYTPDPVTARRATLYVCTMLPADGAREVLAALGLIPAVSVQPPRDSVGKRKYRRTA